MSENKWNTMWTAIAVCVVMLGFSSCQAVQYIMAERHCEASK